MKYAFFAVVLANIILFLWEFQHGAFQPETDYSSQAKNKQILLLNEWRQQEAAKKAAIADAVAVAPETAIDTAEADKQPQEPDAEVIAEAKIDETVADNAPQDLIVAEAALQTEPDNVAGEELAAAGDESGAEETEELAVAEQPVSNNESTPAAELRSKAQTGISTESEEIAADPEKTDEPDVSTKSEKVDEPVVAENLVKSGPESEDALPSKSEIETEKPSNIEVCYEVGPFSSRKQLQQWLESQGIKDRPEIFNKEAQVVSSYLVYYPAADTFEESQRNVEMLKSKGVEEYWLFKQGDMVGAISVGLFREKPHAEKLFRKLNDDGINVKITKRFKSEQVLYVKVGQSIANTANTAIGIVECR